MKKLIGLIILGALAITATATAGLDVTKVVPAETKLVIRVDIQKALQSDLAKDLQDIHDEKVTNLKTFFNNVIGFDVMRLEEAWVMSAKPNTGVVVLKGNFDEGDIRKKFGKLPNVTVQKRDGFKFVAKFKDVKKNKWQMGAVIDNETLAVGDVFSVKTLLDVCDGKVRAMPRDAAVLKKIKADEHHVVGTIMGDLGNWAKDFDPDFAKIIDQVWIRGNIGQDVKANLVIEHDSARSAEGIENLVRGLIIVKGDCEELKAKPFLARIVKTATVKRDNKTVTVSATVPGRDIQGLTALQ